jgi:hypothetical protein
MRIEVKHDLTAGDIGAIEDRLYDFNRHATGAHDGQDLGFVIRDDAGDVVGAALGYSWAGISELRQLWVDERHRGGGTLMFRPIAADETVGPSVKRFLRRNGNILKRTAGRLAGRRTQKGDLQ